MVSVKDFNDPAFLGELNVYDELVNLIVKNDRRAQSGVRPLDHGLDDGVVDYFDSKPEPTILDLFRCKYDAAKIKATTTRADAGLVSRRLYEHELPECLRKEWSSKQPHGASDHYKMWSLSMSQFFPNLKTYTAFDSLLHANKTEDRDTIEAASGTIES